MHRKVKSTQSAQEILDQVSRVLIPEHILKDFEIDGVKENKTQWQIILVEKEDRIPKELHDTADQEIVLDGYCNAVEVMSHSFALKPVYLKIFRRRWKQSNTDKHYSNGYDFQMKGLKIVPELGIFLKEED